MKTKLYQWYPSYHLPEDMKPMYILIGTILIWKRLQEVFTIFLRMSRSTKLLQAEWMSARRGFEKLFKKYDEDLKVFWKCFEDDFKSMNLNSFRINSILRMTIQKDILEDLRSLWEKFRDTLKIWWTLKENVKNWKEIWRTFKGDFENF